MERIKILFTFDIDPLNGDMICIDRKIVDDKVKVSKAEESNVPTLTLEANKFTLNSNAIALLKATAGDKIDIKYQKKENASIPIIGLSSEFGTPDNGNKLTKSNTVAYRGKANTELKKFGSVFTLSPSDTQGLFELVSENAPQEVSITDDAIQIPDDNLTIPEDDSDLMTLSDGFKFTL